MTRRKPSFFFPVQKSTNKNGQLDMNELSNLTFINNTDRVLHLYATTSVIPKEIPIFVSPIMYLAKNGIAPGHLITVSAPAADLANLTIVLSLSLPPTRCPDAPLGSGALPLCLRTTPLVRDWCFVVTGNLGIGYKYKEVAPMAPTAPAGTASDIALRCLPRGSHVRLCSSIFMTLFSKYTVLVTLCAFTLSDVAPDAPDGAATRTALPSHANVSHADPPTQCDARGGACVLAHACEPLHDGSGRMQCVMAYIVAPPLTSMRQ